MAGTREQSKATTTNGWSNPQQGNRDQYHDVTTHTNQSTKPTNPAANVKPTTNASPPQNKTTEESPTSPVPSSVADEKKTGEEVTDPSQQDVTASQLGEQQQARSGFVVPPNRKDTRKLFVGGLPSNVTEHEFREFFEQFGPVLDSVVMFDRDTRRSRGFGFVIFENEATSNSLITEGINEQGIAFGHVTMRGKVCEVKSAEPKDPNVAKNGGGRGSGPMGSGHSRGSQNNSTNGGSGSGFRHQKHNNNYNRVKYRGTGNGGGDRSYSRYGPSVETTAVPVMDASMMGSPTSFQGPPMYAGPWQGVSGYPHPNQAPPPVGAAVMVPGDETTNGQGDGVVNGMAMLSMNSAGAVPPPGQAYHMGGMYYPPAPGGPAYMATHFYNPYHPAAGGYPDQYPTENHAVAPPMPAGAPYAPPPPLDPNGYPIMDPAAAAAHTGNAGYAVFPLMMGSIPPAGTVPPPNMVTTPAEVVVPNTVVVENTNDIPAGDNNNNPVKVDDRPEVEVTNREGQKTGQA